MDIFYFALGTILSQIKEDNFLHLVGFRFHKFSLIKINYEICDKKLLAIVDAFEEWCHLLEGTQHDTSLCVTCPWHKHCKNPQIFSGTSKVAATINHETLTPTK